MILAMPDDPLRPSPDEARQLLRRELISPEYQRDPLERLLAWIQRFFDDAADAAGSLGFLVGLAVVLVVLGLVLGLGWLLSRARPSVRAPARPGGVLPEERVSAAEYRRRAELARTQGRHAAAVVEGFRAVAARQVERGRLDDLPGATAHEVAGRLAADFAEHGDRVHAVAVLFDAVRYGGHPASAADADAVLALEDALAVAR